MVESAHLEFFPSGVTPSSRHWLCCGVDFNYLMTSLMDKNCVYLFLHFVIMIGRRPAVQRRLRYPSSKGLCSFLQNLHTFVDSASDRKLMSWSSIYWRVQVLAPPQLLQVVEHYILLYIIIFSLVYINMHFSLVSICRNGRSPSKKCPVMGERVFGLRL